MGEPGGHEQTPPPANPSDVDIIKKVMKGRAEELAAAKARDAARNAILDTHPTLQEIDRIDREINRQLRAQKEQQSPGPSPSPSGGQEHHDR